jgi:hypothetical protein
VSRTKFARTRWAKGDSSTRVKFEKVFEQFYDEDRTGAAGGLKFPPTPGLENPRFPKLSDTGEISPGGVHFSSWFSL